MISLTQNESMKFNFKTLGFKNTHFATSPSARGHVYLFLNIDKVDPTCTAKRDYGQVI